MPDDPLDDPPDHVGGPGRAHPSCWIGDRYAHVCQEPSGRRCVEDHCTEPAGTRWGKHWCPQHDAIRINRISRQLNGIRTQFDERHEL